MTGFVLLAACGGRGGTDAAEPRGVQTLAFAEQVELLPGFSFDTGLQPEGAPVQASFAVSAKGAVRVEASAAVSGSAQEPTLTGVPGSGVLSIDGGFGLEGQLVVDITGVPGYDGPIPGLDDVSIEVAADTAFDPFALGEGVSVRADIPPTRLPEIPLPGGIPGDLVLEVVDGSFLDVALSGLAVCVEASEATYAVGLQRTGTLVIAPSVEVEVPIVGTKTFEIPQVSVDLDLGTGAEVVMTAEVTAFGARPDEGAHVDAACGVSEGSDEAGRDDGAGEGGTSGDGDDTDRTPGDRDDTDGTSDDGGTTGSVTPDDDDDETAGGDSNGICGTSYTDGDPVTDACLSTHCCGQVDACTYGGTDVQGCRACMNDGGGERCDGLRACQSENCTTEFCGGIGSDLVSEFSECFEDNCCGHFDTCTANGTSFGDCEAGIACMVNCQ